MLLMKFIIPVWAALLISVEQLLSVKYAKCINFWHLNPSIYIWISLRKKMNQRKINSFFNISHSLMENVFFRNAHNENLMTVIP